MDIPKSTMENSLGEVHGSIDTTTAKSGWKKIFSFMGPAYLVSVGYMDPGNWATDIAGGSKYGYTLIWVLLASNLMAVLLQTLSARLGIVRGRDLAQANREYYPPTVNFFLWILAEIAIAATDLAEVLGMAIGIQLLFGLPLIWGVSITVLDTFLLLYLQRLGMKKMEMFIITLIAIIGISFLVNIVLSSPSLNEILHGFIPSLPDAGTLYQREGIIGAIPRETALYIAIGMIGATVMPHNLYLHSALIQTRKINRTEKGIKEALKWSFIDSVIALNIAFFINAAILILAATVFFKSGRTNVGEISEAHSLLSPLLGTGIASVLFAVALIASGQSSTVTGTLSGQIVMEGYLKIRLNPLARRLLTRLIAIVPAVIFILISGEENVDRLLIFSQVILSMQLGFAIIPLIHFVSDKETMKQFVIKKSIQVVAWLMVAVLVSLNLRMILEETTSYWQQQDSFLIKSLVVLSFIFFGCLLLYVLLLPLFKKKIDKNNIAIHPSNSGIKDFTSTNYKRIAVALDFTKNDHKLLEAAVAQPGESKTFLLIHIVESPGSHLHGNQTADHETEQDRIRLDEIVREMMKRGYQAEGILGFKDRSKEIARILHEHKAELLIIGSHGHKGLKDVLFGTTINKVRHLVQVPIFVVNA
jgi:manganese transport protein